MLFDESEVAELYASNVTAIRARLLGKKTLSGAEWFRLDRRVQNAASEMTKRQVKAEAWADYRQAIAPTRNRPDEKLDPKYVIWKQMHEPTRSRPDAYFVRDF